MIKNLRFFIITLIILLILIIIIIYQRPISSLIVPEKTKRSIISILKSENISFLVTNKIATQIVVEREEVSFLGNKKGALIGNVTLYYGIDLNELSIDSITIEKNEIIVRLPSPKPLDFSVDLSSIRFFKRETGLLRLKGFFVDDEKMREEIEDMFYKEALFFMKTQGMLPKNEDVLRSLEVIREIISLKTGLKTKFVIGEIKKPLY